MSLQDYQSNVLDLFQTTVTSGFLESVGLFLCFIARSVCTLDMDFFVAICLRRRVLSGC